MVRLVGATLLLLAPLHVTNAGSLTFLKSTKEHQQVEPHLHRGMGMGKGHGKHAKNGHKKAHAEHKHEHHHHRHHKGECWEHRPVHPSFAKASFMQLEQTPHSLKEPQMSLPGAGMHPDDIEPFQMVTKDGFLLTACTKDAMLEHGDKFGNGKHRYKFGSVSNVSIVHYAEIIPKEDREKMTINRCFDFCRTVPNMVYFGLQGGRDCYCTPYYKPMAGDNSNCDLTCEGDPNQMCGGKTRSSVFEMHSCDDTRSELEDIITQVEDKIFLHLQDLRDHVKDVADEGLWDATELQKTFGLAGGVDTSAYMQEAKVYSGELEKPALDAQKLIDSLQDPYDAASSSLNKNLRDFSNLKVAEDAIKALQEGVAAAADLSELMHENMRKAHPVSLLGHGSEGDEFNSTEAATQYYPIMYFVEDEYRVKFVTEGSAMWHHPTTCTGNFLQIIFGATADDCANACDGIPGKCDGFQFIAFNDGMCILFESILTVEQWVGCTLPGDGDKQAPFDAQCMGKLSRLEGVGGIAPREDAITEEAQGAARGRGQAGGHVRQGDGGCAHCLKSMDKWDRCYDYKTQCIGNKHDMQLYYEWGVEHHGWTPQPGDHESSCDRLAANNPGWCTWDWGRPGYYSGSGQWLQAAQVCPQCGYCIDNGKSAGNPSIPWEDENWEGDPIQSAGYYYYYYY
jgi:hypothetical protein